MGVDDKLQIRFMKYFDYRRRDHQWDALKGTAETAASDPVRNAICRETVRTAVTANRVSGRKISHRVRRGCTYTYIYIYNINGH